MINNKLFVTKFVLCFYYFYCVVYYSVSKQIKLVILKIRTLNNKIRLLVIVKFI